MFSPNTVKHGPVKNLHLDTFQAVINNLLSKTGQLRYNARNSKTGVDGATENKLDNIIPNSEINLEC